jgi:hypothetical protein
LDRQTFVDRLLETENLTDQLEDDDANILLDWGVQHIDGLIEGLEDHDAAGEKVNGLMHVMRSLNSLAGDPKRISQEGLADLLKRYSQIVEGNVSVDENEHRVMAEKMADMQPGTAIRYLTEWLQSKNA